MNAWVTLLTQPDYLAGVRTLRASLERSGSVHPLVVMVTDGIDAASRDVLRADGCLLRDVEALRPAREGTDGYANARFAEVWTKLEVWRLTEFDRVVFLDADMLVTQGMDELFSLVLAADGLAACHACRCNPNGIASYPASWTPQNCFYTHCRGPEHTSEPGIENYLNGGLLVLTPDDVAYDELVARVRRIEDMSRYPFAEQDLLNEVYRGRWTPLPYVYNALKTLQYQHRSLWDISAVKNIHYIIDKPWQRPLDPDDPYFALNTLWWDVAATV